MGWRYFATRIDGTTGTETRIADFELNGAELTLEINGHGAITGTISPETAGLRDDDGAHVFQPWSTGIYAVRDEDPGTIRAGGLLPGAPHQEQSLYIDAPGHTAYPEGRPYLHTYSQIGIDPLDVYRYIWSYIQTRARANLGITVDATTSPVRIGTKAAPAGTTDDRGGPYTLTWHDTPNLGERLDQLINETPFETFLTHQWREDGTIGHHIRVGYPRLGRRLTTERFVLGENIYTAPKWEPPATIADQVLVLGAGTGAARVKGSASRSPAFPVSRHVTLTDPTLTTTAECNRAGDQYLRQAGPDTSVAELLIEDHPHARLGTYMPGDEIEFQAPDTWEGDKSVWLRIVSLTYITATDQTRIRVTRAGD